MRRWISVALVIAGCGDVNRIRTHALSADLPASFVMMSDLCIA
ncbi:MAG: hypothetical protein ABI467_11260 [Kofleriaceae bacterium]